VPPSRPPYRIEWTDTALERVQEQSDFLAVRSAKKATSMINRIFDRVEQLAAFPRLGPEWPRGQHPDLRQLVVEDYLVIYSVDDASETVSILTVRSARQKPIGPDEL